MSQINSGLVECFYKGMFRQFCIDLLIEEIITLIILIIVIRQLLSRYQSFKDCVKKKNRIYHIMIFSLTCYMIYNIDQQYLVIAYFFQLYGQYLFLIYIVYYFARKTLKLKTFTPEKLYQIILYCYSLVVFYTIFLLWNLGDYIRDMILQEDYYLQQIFHIMRIIGFVIDVILIIIAHILHRLIGEKLQSFDDLTKTLKNHDQIIQKVLHRRSNFWKLVVITFIGQLLYFVDDVYFLVDDVKQCDFLSEFINDQSHVWTYIMVALIIFVSFQLPYVVTILIFWFRPETKSQQPSVSIEIETDQCGFSILNPNSKLQQSPQGTVQIPV